MQGGTDLTFKVECSGNLESDGEIKQWIEPVSFTIYFCDWTIK